MNRMLSRRAATSCVTLLTATLAAGVLVYRFDPAVTWWFPSCPWYALTGWLCPLCGSLRAVHALLHGHPLVALGLNPLTTLAGLTVGVAIAIDAIHPREEMLVGRLARAGFSAPAIVVALTFGVVRNLVE
jgi:uncharacterized protein DUF2752